MLIETTETERHTTLLGKNIIEHMGHLSTALDASKSYWSRESKLWRAISNHISGNHINAKKHGCVIIDKPKQENGSPRSIRSYRGTGPDISIEEVSCYKNDKNIMFRFQVAYCPDGDYYYAEESCNDEHQTYWIYVPKELELDFTQEAFDKWVEQLKQKKEAEIQEKELKILKQLMKKYKDQV